MEPTSKDQNKDDAMATWSPQANRTLSEFSLECVESLFLTADCSAVGAEQSAFEFWEQLHKGAHYKTRNGDLSLFHFSLIPS